MRKGFLEGSFLEACLHGFLEAFLNVFLGAVPVAFPVTLKCFKDLRTPRGNP